MRSAVNDIQDPLQPRASTGTLLTLPIRRPEPSDADLVRGTLEGNAEAKEALFRRHAPMVFGLAHRVLGGHPEDIDDLAQDAFLQAFEGLRKLHEPQAFAKWIGTIVIRGARRRIRRATLRRRLGFSSPPAFDPDSVVGCAVPPDLAAELRALYEILQSLPADERIALVLRRVEGLTLPEIAQYMEISLATAKRRIAAAETLLQIELRHP